VLIVVPISNSDRNLLPRVEEAFAAFSPGSGHKLLVVGSPNVSSWVNQAAQNLSKYFAGNAKTYIFDMDCGLGWPGACNYYFQQVAWFIPANYDEPWLWFELDTTPMRAGWLDEIDSAIQPLITPSLNSGSLPRYFGVKEPTYLEYQGGLMPDAGHQMAAVGVYPAHMDDVLSLRAVSATNIPWNTFLRWYFMPYFQELPLFQNNWQTANYHREKGDKGKILCDSVAKWAWDVHFNNPISSKAALVHGCKDGTLLDVLAPELVTK
jgi:hypothetical protein